jgi:hypothetical protein
MSTDRCGIGCRELSSPDAIASPRGVKPNAKSLKSFARESQAEMRDDRRRKLKRRDDA